MRSLFLTIVLAILMTISFIGSGIMFIESELMVASAGEPTDEGTDNDTDSDSDTEDGDEEDDKGDEGDDDHSDHGY